MRTNMNKMVIGINLNMKWNDYESDTLYLWNGHDLYVIAEGNGSNLSDEDIEKGYKDYWMTYIVGSNYTDGGQWMETKPIIDIDYTIQGVIDRMMKCDLWKDKWKVLDKKLGIEIYEAYKKNQKLIARINRLKQKAMN